MASELYTTVMHQLVTLRRLSYKGLGEPICFVAFGPLSTTAFYLAQVSNCTCVFCMCGSHRPQAHTMYAFHLTTRAGRRVPGRDGSQCDSVSQDSFHAALP